MTGGNLKDGVRIQLVDSCNSHLENQVLICGAPDLRFLSEFNFERQNFSLDLMVLEHFLSFLEPTKIFDVS